VQWDLSTFGTDLIEKYPPLGLLINDLLVLLGTEWILESPLYLSYFVIGLGVAIVVFLLFVPKLFFGITSFIKFIYSLFSYEIDKQDSITHHLVWIIFFAFAGFLTWAYLAEIERVVTANGKAYPYSKLQTVEHYEGGRVESIQVSSGQTVTQGQLLVTLSPLQTTGELNIQADQLAELSIRQSRLLAEYQNKKEFAVPSLIGDEHSEIVKQELAYFTERKRQRQVQLTAKVSEVNSAKAKNQAAKVGLTTAEREFETMKLLFERGLEPELSMIQSRKALADAISGLETSKQELLRAESGVDAVIREQQTQILKELSEVRSQLTSARENIRVAADKADRTELRAPVAGIVNTVLVATVGGTVKPGETVVEIVPEGSEIVVEARVSPADIGFIEVGQEALIKITAYDFSVFGSLKGRVDVIAADTTTDEETGEKFYKINVSFLEEFRDARGRNLAIIPGMEAQVDVVVGMRSVMDYVLSPLMRATQESLREK
jgi:adhesin transport system membrane fusion protein